jgi:hypothetical protein
MDTDKHRLKRGEVVPGRSNGLATGNFFNFQPLAGLNVAAPEDGRAPFLSVSIGVHPWFNFNTF